MSDAEVLEAGRAYDRFANRYDGLLDENRINAYMRRQMMETLRTTFPPGTRLLDIGCGTGDEALAMAERGCRVAAIDPSVSMLAVAERKAARVSQGRSVLWRLGRARDLGALLVGEPNSGFDGAYSSFALSYEPHLESIREPLARIVRPRGRLVVAAMNRLCLAESLLAAMSGRPTLAGRRFGPSTLHKVGDVQTTVYPRTPWGLAESFGPEFAVRNVRALPIALPPHYANRPLRRWPALLTIAERVDARISHLPVLRSLGDHTVMTLERVP